MSEETSKRASWSLGSVFTMKESTPFNLDKASWDEEQVGVGWVLSAWYGVKTEEKSNDDFN